MNSEQITQYLQTLTDDAVKMYLESVQRAFANDGKLSAEEKVRFQGFGQPGAYYETDSEPDWSRWLEAITAEMARRHLE